MPVRMSIKIVQRDRISDTYRRDRTARPISHALARTASVLVVSIARPRSPDSSGHPPRFPALPLAPSTHADSETGGSTHAP